MLNFWSHKPGGGSSELAHNTTVLDETDIRQKNILRSEFHTLRPEHPGAHDGEGEEAIVKLQL